MKTFAHPILRTALLGAALLTSPLLAQEPAPSAKDLAAQLSTGLQDGSSTVRMKMEMRPSAGGAKTSFQIQAEARRTKSSTDILYKVLWPKTRKGESFVLRKSDSRGASGATFTPPDTLQTLTAAQMQEGVFGSDLAYEDLLENFFAWESQAIVGTENIGRVPCQILESKPGKGGRTSYGRVRSWIDTKKMVPLRVEKYLASGQLARRIETTQVNKDDNGRSIPSALTVQRPGHESITEIDGSDIRHDVKHPDGMFQPETLRAISTGSKPK